VRHADEKGGQAQVEQQVSNGENLQQLQQVQGAFAAPSAVGPRCVAHRYWGFGAACAQRRILKYLVVRRGSCSRCETQVREAAALLTIEAGCQGRLRGGGR
jgi:hypothetical protein